MANHVHNYVTFNGNKTAQAVWNLLFDRDLMENVSQYHPDAPAEYDWEWQADNIGPKWATMEDTSEDHFSAISAWGPVDEFAAWLSGELSKADPDSYVIMEAEDEMPNWFGVWVFQGGDVVDYTEFDWDDLMNHMFKLYPETKEAWDEENQEWDYDHEGYEIFDMHMYEELHDMQSNALEDIIRNI